MTELQNDMPPGWDCKRDENTGKYYYINHYTRTTTWEDPRHRHRPFQGTPKNFTNVQTEYIPMQHGSPDSRRNYVYPSQTSPIPAFQMPAHITPKRVPLQDMRSRMSPLTVRSAKVQDSSLVVTDTDESVAKIAAMFPTVPETHVRMLLKKYNSREALVISALQVEKYPITTPGPFATPPPQRSALETPPLGFRLNSRGGSPICRPASGSPRTGGEGFRSSPRPHSSPKLKLRYMKSVFPQADETIILDILQNNENNIQKTTDALKDMGFNKKDTVKAAHVKQEAKKEEERQEAANKIKPVSPILIVKTAEEKRIMKEQLQEKYKDVAEHLISIALESVSFDESRANQILQIMLKEDTKASVSNESTENEITVVDIAECPSTSKIPDLPVSQSRQSLKSLLKTEKELDKVLYSRIVEDDGDACNKSKNLSDTKGPNCEFAKGANDKLLLEDYVKWLGPNPSLRKGPQGLATGPSAGLLSCRTYRPCGPNLDIRKGSRFGLAKGGIFSGIKSIAVGESHRN